MQFPRLLLSPPLSTGRRGRGWMSITGGKGNGDRYACIDYSLLPLGVYRMFRFELLLFFLKMKICKCTVCLIPHSQTNVICPQELKCIISDPLCMVSSFKKCLSRPRVFSFWAMGLGCKVYTIEFAFLRNTQAGWEKRIHQFEDAIQCGRCCDRQLRAVFEKPRGRITLVFE